MRFDQKEHLKKIARAGGLARIKLHGNPGTILGRKRGGLVSIQSHRNLKNSPFLPREVIIPTFSPDLAEFIGILLGDGGVTSRQVTITLHKSDDREYAKYVVKLIENVFNIPVVIKERRTKDVNIIVLSRTRIVEFLGSINIPVGSKVRNQVEVPDWIKDNTNCKKKCLRGLFDTDGCFYVDKHLIKDKIYKNAGMNFTNRSLPLLKFFKDTLIEEGFAPTQTSKYCVVLRKEPDIVRYFGEIGSSNPKHANKLRVYLHEKRKGVRVVE